MNVPGYLLIALALLLQGCCAEKIQVELFAEAGCPYCARFVASNVAAMFKNGLSELMDFSYIAWGNARNNTGPVSQKGRLRTLIRNLQDFTVFRRGGWVSSQVEHCRPSGLPGLPCTMSAL